MGKLNSGCNVLLTATYSTASKSRSAASIMNRGTGRPAKPRLASELKKSLEATTGKSWSIWEVRNTFRSLGRSRSVMSVAVGKSLIEFAARTLPVDFFNRLSGTPTTQLNVAGTSTRASSSESNSGDKRPSNHSEPATNANLTTSERSGDEKALAKSTNNELSNAASSAQNIIEEIYSKAQTVVNTVSVTSFLKNPFVVGAKVEERLIGRHSLDERKDKAGFSDLEQSPSDGAVAGKPLKEKLSIKNITSDDWGLDPDIKPYLQDMNLEWKFIEARTRYLVSKLHTFSDCERTTKIRLLEELQKHLLLYREARVKACEEGAVKSLLKVLKKSDEDVFIKNTAREILACLGENPPIKGQGIRVLSIDGGGTRGLIAIEVLRAIEKQTGKRIHEIFDYICGVSTGSILAFLLGARRRTLDDCEALYKQLSVEIFNQNTVWGTTGLFWNHSYYNTATWEKILKRHIGDTSLLHLARDADMPRVSAISTIVSQERVFPYVFRTYGFKPHIKPRYAGGSNYEMWQAVRASAAAPTYFEEVKLGHYLHQDGGVLVNNPASVALSEAKTIWQNRSLQSVVSIGTGQTFSSRKDPHLSDLIAPTTNSPNSLSWKGKFLKVLDSATDTESVHHTLNELLPSDVYFRFNPYLTEMISLDEARPDRLEQLQRETQEYLLRNHDKVQLCCETLSKDKGITNRVMDWWQHAV